MEIGQQRAFALIDAGRLEDAAAELDTLSAGLESLLPADRVRTLTWTEVARVRLAGARGQSRTLEQTMETALASYSETPGRSDLELGWILAELAACELQVGYNAKARQLAERALALITSESSGVYWANAWAVSRAAGAKGDERNDRVAQEVLSSEGVETQLAKGFLARN
jgi:tetratricopeptide (TPR) repeat protein